jgi:glycosyltransferase involved in cell wall biosynthesis
MHITDSGTAAESAMRHEDDTTGDRRAGLSGLRIVRYYPRAATGDGGMTGAVLRWSNAVTELGSTVTIVHDGGLAPAGGNGPVRWVDLSHRGTWRTRIPVGLGGALRDADVLVLHSGWTAHGIRAAAVARRLGVPYVLEPRGAYDPHIVRRKAVAKRLWWYVAERRLVQDAAAVHLFYDDERAGLAELGHHGPFVVAPNGTPVAGEAVWRGGGGYLLFLGRFDVEHKGLDLLVRAVGQLPTAARPRIRLHGSDHHGGGGIRAVRRLIEQSGVDAWITIHPRVSGGTKRQCLAECDGFVYPSRWDACPNAVLEAVGLGVPTLATPYPLARDLASHGGLILAEPTVAGLASGLSRLATDPSKRELSVRGTQVVASRYAWPRVARMWLEQVTSILGDIDDRRSAQRDRRVA